MKNKLVSLSLLYTSCLDREKNYFKANLIFLLNLLSRFFDSASPKNSRLTLFLQSKNQLFASYKQWLLLHEKEEKNEQVPDIGLISIIVPLYNPDIVFLKQCVFSVVEQEYSNWELILVDDKSENIRELEEFLNTILRSDSRVKFKKRTRNGHISACSNTGIELANGKFVIFLDQDDFLNKRCLSEFAFQVTRTPEADFLYADEDLASSLGRHSPAFKPGFSPQTLLSRNYITHPVLIKKDLIEKVGGFREGVEGSQDHDLFLRISKEAKSIVNLPKVLYHWRVHEKSTSNSISSKPYIIEASYKSIKDYFGSEVSVFSTSSNYPNYYRIHSALKIDCKLLRLSEEGLLVNSKKPFCETFNDVKEKYVLFLGEGVKDPHETVIQEALSVLELTSVNILGGALVYKNRMLPSAYFLKNHYLQSFYSYKKYPFTGYHGFGLAMTNVDAVNPNFCFVRTESLKAKVDIFKNCTNFFEEALKYFKVNSGEKPECVFAPYIFAEASETGVEASEKVYKLFNESFFQNKNSKYISVNIGLTKRSFYYR